MEAKIILVVGCIVLTCGSLGLLIARFTNPALKGLGWLGGAFALGALCAAFMVGSGGSSLASALGADLLTLGGFVLLHVAVLELTGSRSLVPRLGLALLAVQLLGDLVQLAHPHLRLRVLLATLTIAAQSAQTGAVLWRFSREHIRIPARFSSMLLLGFTGLNVARASVVHWHLSGDPQLAFLFRVLGYALYLAVALGLAFGFFWMTTALLSSQLDILASTDPLTHLSNRRTFVIRSEKELLRAAATGSALSILMLDLDHFKTINDRFGHAAGDQALCAAAQQMQGSIRGVDVLARWGGEEFTCMLPDATFEAAARVAERMRANIEGMSLTVPATGSKRKETVRLTASIGVATLHAQDTLNSLLERADQGLYQAKAGGRNRVCDHLGHRPALAFAPPM